MSARNVADYSAAKRIGIHIREVSESEVEISFSERISEINPCL